MGNVSNGYIICPCCKELVATDGNLVCEKCGYDCTDTFHNEYSHIAEDDDLEED